MTELRPIPTMSLAVVGVHHPNADGSNRRFEVELLAPGDPVDLVPEPTNKKDPRAVAVFARAGGQLGYLTAERCGRIGALIREGREVQAVFQAGASHGAWIRVAFDGAVPVVAPAAPARRMAEAERIDPDPEFYPDPIWIDD